MTNHKSQKLKFLKNLKSKSWKLKANKGFTLVELLSVMAISILLGSILVANSRDPSQKFDVRRGAQTLAADLRKVQGFALAPQPVDCDGENKVPYYGFRIQANASADATYSIFADCDRDLSFDEGGSGGDFIIETHVLSRVVAKETIPESGGDDFLEIVYIPPIPDIAINGATFSYPSMGTFQIDLCYTFTQSVCNSVLGNSRGGIEVQ